MATWISIKGNERDGYTVRLGDTITERVQVAADGSTTCSCVAEDCDHAALVSMLGFTATSPLPTEQDDELLAA